MNIHGETMVDRIYIPKSDVLDLITETHESGGFADYSDYSELWDSIDDMPVADVQPVSQWISVEDKLPIEQGSVLCYARSTTGEGNYRILGTLRNGEFWFLQVDGTQLSFPCLHLKVTHWMSLPKPPKED